MNPVGFIVATKASLCTEPRGTCHGEYVATKPYGFRRLFLHVLGVLCGGPVPAHFSPSGGTGGGGKILLGSQVGMW